MKATLACILLCLVLFLPREADGISESFAVKGRKAEFTGTRKKSSPNGAQTPCNGVPSVPSHRRACNFYIWDAPSALFYKWCHHLVKDHIYEGKGGHMFVRYESNSMLQLLYPCSRYSPNRCLVCGGSFPDHLELWWSKHAYAPFDRHLDGTYCNALIVNEEVDQISTKSRRGVREKPKAAQVQTTVAPSYAFHRGYVLDISQELTPEDKSSSSSSSVADLALRLEKAKEKIAKEKTWSGGSKVRLLSLLPAIAYAVPDVAGESRKGLALVMRSVRAQVLHAIDSLLDLQEKENQKFKN